MKHYYADQALISVDGMRWVVRSVNGAIVCYARECDGLTALENAERIADLLNGAE